MREANKNKIKKATALKYSPRKDTAPQIVAKGKGDTATRIVEKAKTSEVPIHYDPYLATALDNMNIGDEIPTELYEVIAQILAFVGKLDSDYEL